MPSTLPSFVFGFHGCDKSVAEAVISGDTSLRPSENSYDWLGNGIYFWENNPSRAMQYAQALKKNPRPRKKPIKTPAVIGAIIDCGFCLNLLESESIDIVKKGYELFIELNEKSQFDVMPANQIVEDGFPLVRQLDCAVMEMIHTVRKDNEELEFETVRAMFPEGKPLYPTSGFLDKNHIQICVRNPKCIKGFFRVPEPNEWYYS